MYTYHSVFSSSKNNYLNISEIGVYKCPSVFTPVQDQVTIVDTSNMGVYIHPSVFVAPFL